MIDVSEPTGWVRAWARVMAMFPGAKPMPRIDVIRRALGRERILGQFHASRYAVTLFDDGDRQELLHTLIHELAHAWSPLERQHHGPRWQQCYADLISWLFAHQLERGHVRKTALENGWDKLVDDNGKMCGRGQAMMMFALDVALSTEIERRRPSVHVEGTLIVATLQNPTLVRRAFIQETPCRERSSPTARRSASR